MQFADGYEGSIPLTKEYSAMVSIRTGIVSDVPLLRTLIQEFATFERLPVTITEEQLRQDGFGAQPKFRILIAECDGQPAGYALFFDCYSSFQGRGIFLEDLFVRPSLRGKNVGRALLGHVARMAEEVDGFGVMFNVLDWNQKAIEFYQKIGATFLDDWKTVCLKNKALHDLASQIR
jgi:GNAT superfamily N-acetyltransferase